MYKCIHGTCTATFHDLSDYVTHVQQHDAQTTAYGCHMCNKQFTSLADLGTHQYMHNLYPALNNKAEAKYVLCDRG